MADNFRRVALLGLPGAGKTTYAVVFAAACEAGKDGMRITQYAGVGNRQYLNERADELAHCVELDRTKQQARDEIRLRAELTSGGVEQELVMPDLSGEFLRDSMAARALDDDLYQLVDATDALLLFVRTNKLLRPETISDFNDLLRTIGEEPGGDAVAPDTADDWYAELACTQARLTDVFQELIRVRGGRHVRLGLVLSAWDSQPGESVSPGEWAERYLPLLIQTLENEPLAEWDVFGVSAQGGDFHGPERPELEKIDVAERPKVQRRDGQPVGIGAPLRWALEST